MSKVIKKAKNVIVFFEKNSITFTRMERGQKTYGIFEIEQRGRF